MPTGLVTLSPQIEYPHMPHHSSRFNSPAIMEFISMIFQE